MLHLVNYEDEFQSDNKLFWESPYKEDKRKVYGPTGEPMEAGSRKPIAEIIVGKSKLEEFKGEIFFRFDPARCKFTECNDTEMRRCRKDGPRQKWIQSRNQ